ncbi:MAG: TetR/AcrR family transcriptional regulator [Planctomycetota bacterium]
MAARIVKAYDERRNELLDAARRLFLRHGYDETTVSAVIEEVGVSKGAFYHYFDSKEHLLDALVERLTDESLGLVRPIVEADGLDAIEKLNRFFGRIRCWKAEQMPLMLTIIRAMYRDENLVLRHKMFERNVERAGPLLGRVIRQGVDEGLMDTGHPDLAGEMILRVASAFSDMLAGLLLTIGEHPERLPQLERRIDLYQDAIRRLLGAPEGAIRVVDDDFLAALREAASPAQGGADG